MNSLVKDISKDLKIDKFDGELDSDYINRLIFSCSACWCKTLIYSEMINEGCVNSTKTKIKNRLDKIIYGLIRSLNMEDHLNLKNLLIEDYISNVSKYILKELEFLYEICFDKNNRIYIQDDVYSLEFSNNYNLIRGLPQYLDDRVFIGLCQWKKSNELDNEKLISNIIDIRDYYNCIKRNFIWRKYNYKIENVEIFIPCIKSDFHKNWENYEYSNIGNGVYLIRKIILDSNFKYSLLKKEDNVIFLSDLDDWYYKERENYRFMYIFSDKCNCNVEFTCSKFTDRYIIKCTNNLPNYEKRILNSCSWPYYDYKDECNRIVPIELWHIVANMLEELKINIKYI